MLKLLIAILLLSLCSDCIADDLQKQKEIVDLILVAGQSNAVGFDTNPDQLPESPIDKKVRFWWRCGDPLPDKYDSTSHNKWTFLQVQSKGKPNTDKKLKRQYGNFKFAKGGFGPEIGLARYLYAKQHHRLAIVKVAFSGTNVADDWDHSGKEKRGACYRSLVKETKSAIKAAQANGRELKLRALVWVQGESDANKTDAVTYEKNLGVMIQSLRKDLNAPKMIILLGVNTKYRKGKNLFMPKIIQAQQSLAGYTSRCEYVDTSTAPIANQSHFNTKGTLEVGVLFAKGLVKLEKNGKKE